MLLQTKRPNIIERVRHLLTAMSDVYYVMEDEKLVLRKNENTFGKIENGIVYLLNENREFAKVNKEILEAVDDFLRAATQSYYVAAVQASLKRARVI